MSNRMKHIEENLQIACVTWFNLQYSALSPYLVHVPNGGKRNAREGARFKKMGVRAGFPDLMLLVPKNGIHALFIEMKSAGGRQADSQKKYMNILNKMCYDYVICNSFDNFVEIINRYLRDEKTV